MGIKKKLITTVTTIAMMFSTMSTQCLAQQLSTKEEIARINQENVLSSIVQEQENQERFCYKGNGYTIEFKVTDKWADKYCGELILTNTGDKPLENWVIKTEFKSQINNIWNAEIISHNESTYIIKNAGWNQKIESGQSVKMGFEATYVGKIEAPQSYSLIASKEEVNNDAYDIKFSVVNDWGDGYNAQICMTNNTSEVLENWQLEFDFEQEIERFWTAEIVSHKGSHYVIKNLGYNANIKPGETLTLGFAGTPGKVQCKPANYVLTQSTYKNISDSGEVDDKNDKERISKIIQEAIANNQQAVVFYYGGKIEEAQALVDQILAETENKVESYNISHSEVEGALQVAIEFTYKAPPIEVEENIEEVIRTAIANQEGQVACNYGGMIEQLKSLLNNILEDKTSSKVKEYTLSYSELEGALQVVIEFTYKEPIAVEENIEESIKKAIQERQPIATYNYGGKIEELETIINNILEEEISNEVENYMLSYSELEDILQVTISFVYKEEDTDETIKELIREAIANKQEIVTCNYKGNIEELETIITSILDEEESNKVQEYILNSNEIDEEMLEATITFSYKQPIKVDDNIEEIIEQAIANKQEIAACNYGGTIEELRTLISTILEKETSIEVEDYTITYDQVEDVLRVTISFTYQEILETDEDIIRVISEAVANQEEIVEFNCRQTDVLKMMSLLNGINNSQVEQAFKYHMSCEQSSKMASYKITFSYIAKEENIPELMRQALINEEKTVEFYSDKELDNVVAILTDIMGEEVASKVTSCEYRYETVGGLLYITVQFEYIAVEENIAEFIRNGIKSEEENISFYCKESIEEVVDILGTIMGEEIASKVENCSYFYRPIGDCLYISVKCEYLKIEEDVAQLIKSSISNREETVAFYCKESIEEVVAILTNIMGEEVASNIVKCSYTYRLLGEYIYVIVNYEYAVQDITQIIRQGILDRQQTIEFYYTGTIEQVKEAFDAVLVEMPNMVDNYSIAYADLGDKLNIIITITYLGESSLVDPKIEEIIRTGIANEQELIEFDYEGNLSELQSFLGKAIKETSTIKDCKLSYEILEGKYHCKINIIYNISSQDIVENVEQVIKKGLSDKKETIEFVCRESESEVYDILMKAFSGTAAENYQFHCEELGDNLHVVINVRYAQAAENIQDLIRQCIANRQEILEFCCKESLEEVAELINNIAEKEGSGAVKDYTISYNKKDDLLDLQIKIQYKNNEEIIEGQIIEALRNRLLTIELNNMGQEEKVDAIINKQMEEASIIIKDYKVTYKEDDGTKAVISINYNDDRQIYEAIKDEIKSALMDKKEEVEIGWYGSLEQYEENIDKMLNEIEDNTPLIDPVKKYSVKEGSKGLSLKFKYESELEEDGASKLEFTKATLNNIINSITNESMSDHEKLQSIFEYVIGNYSYDKTLTQRNLYNALKDKTMVCTGYANLIYQLCKLAGIECICVVNETHAWNMIYLDDKWYHLDATYADTIGRYPYTYYMLSTDEISKFSGHTYEVDAYPIAGTNYLESIKDNPVYHKIYETILAGRSTGEAYFNEQEMELNINDSKQRIIPFSATSMEDIVLKSDNEKIVAIAGDRFKTVGVGETDIYICTKEDKVICKAHVTVIDCGIDDLIIGTKVEKQVIFEGEDTTNTVSVKTRKGKTIKILNLWMRDKDDKWTCLGEMQKNGERNYSFTADFANEPIGTINLKVVAEDEEEKISEKELKIKHTDLEVENIFKVNQITNEKISELLATQEDKSTDQLIEEIRNVLIDDENVKLVWVENNMIKIKYTEGVYSYIQIENQADVGKRARGTEVGNEVADISDEKWEYVDISSKKVLIWAPFDNEWQSKSEVNELKEIVKNSKIGLETTVISNEQADIQSLNKLKDYGIIIFATHGKDGELLVTSEKVNDVKYKEEIAAGEITIYEVVNLANKTKDTYYAVTDLWFKNHLDTLANSIIINNSCESLAREKLSESFKEHGSAAYFGYSAPIDNITAKENVIKLMTVLVGDNVSSSIAQTMLYDKVKDESSFKLSGSKNAMATNFEMGFENDLSRWDTTGDVNITEGCVVDGSTVKKAFDGTKCCMLTTKDGYSEISQKVVIPKNATILRFDWLYGTTTSTIPDISVEIEGEGKDSLYGELGTHNSLFPQEMLKTNAGYLEKKKLLNRVKGGEYSITDWENMHYGISPFFRGQEATITFKLKDSNSSDGFSFACIDNLRFLDDSKENVENEDVEITMPSDIKLDKNTMKLSFKVTNKSKDNLSLKDVNIRYYYSTDNSPDQEFKEEIISIDGTVEADEVKAYIEKLTEEDKYELADACLKVNFSNSNKVLASGEEALIEIIIRNPNLDVEAGEQYCITDDHTNIELQLATDVRGYSKKEKGILGNVAGTAEKQYKKYKLIIAATDIGTSAGYSDLDKVKKDDLGEAFVSKYGAPSKYFSKKGYEFLQLYEMTCYDDEKKFNSRVVSATNDGTLTLQYYLTKLRATYVNDGCLTLGFGTALPVDEGIDTFKKEVINKLSNVGEYALAKKLEQDANLIIKEYNENGKITEEFLKQRGGYWVTTKQATNMMNGELVNTHIRRVVQTVKETTPLKIEGVNYKLYNYQYSPNELDALITTRYKWGNFLNWVPLIDAYKKETGYTSMQDWKNTLKSSDTYRLNDEIEMFLLGDYDRDGNGW